MSAALDRIVALFPDAKPAGNGRYKARCPCHADKNPSLSMSEGAGGRVLLHCFAGCTTEAVCAAKGIRVADLFPPKAEDHPAKSCERKPTVYSTIEAATADIARRVQGQFVKAWTYHNADGSESFRSLRFALADGDKTYRPVHRNGSGWVAKDPPGLLPLYGLPTLNGAARVWNPEGEKCADAARSIGLTATTSAHGAKSAHKSNWTPLAGREVIISPDNDGAGEHYAAEVADILSTLEPPARVKIVRLPGLPEGGDIADWLDSCDAKTPEELREALDSMAEAAPWWTPPTAGTDAAGFDDDKTAALATLCTDVGNAARLVRRHGADLRYCAPWGKWVAWDRARWCPDSDLQVMRHAKDTAISIYAEAAASAKAEDGRSAKLSTWALTSQRRERLSAMVDLARCELSVLPTALDADAWLLNVLNGTIDLRTGVLREHRRDDLITKLAPVQFDTAATCPLWDRFLARIMGGDGVMISYLQRIAGMCLTGDIREQCLFIFYGTGANGKSVFLDTLAGLLGDYAGEAAPDLLVIRRSEEHPCEVADLCGKRLVVASETEEGIRLKVQLIKRLTGNARIKARFMRQDYFEFARTHKLILATNNRPVVREGTHAIKRRLRLIPFDVTIPESEQDKELLRKLAAEWPGILAWAVRGCLDWQRDGLTPPAAVSAATQSYLDEQDLLRDFLESCCVLTADAWTERTALFAAYQKWAEAAGERLPLDRTRFYERVRRAGIEDDQRRLQSRPKRGFSGIGLLSNEGVAGA